MIPICQPIIGQEEIDAVTRVMGSGHIAAGPQCEAFEREFAAAEGAKYGVAVSSGTAALTLALKVYIRPGDEVLVPALTFFGTISSVIEAGGVPVYVDIEPGTLTMDPMDAAGKVTDKTMALVPVHLFGNPCDIRWLKRLAKARGLAAIWDNAQAHGATYKGRRLGGIGDVACYSFYATKNMTTGEGGMVVTNNEDLACHIRRLANHGQVAKYRHEHLGQNHRMTDIQAAMGRMQLRHLDEWVGMRQLRANILRDDLSKIPGLSVQEQRGESAYHQFVIMVDPEVAGISRDELRDRLYEMGIETAVHYPCPVYEQSAVRDYTQDCPVAKRVSEQILSVPVHPGVAVIEAKIIARRIAQCVSPS